MAGAACRNRTDDLRIASVVVTGLRPVAESASQLSAGAEAELGEHPEEGERLADAEGASKDSVLNSALVPLHYPAANGGEPAMEFAIKPASFHDAFAADLPAEEAAVMAATQRPVAALAFPEPTGRPPRSTCPPGPLSPESPDLHRLRASPELCGFGRCGARRTQHLHRPGPVEAQPLGSIGGVDGWEAGERPESSRWAHRVPLPRPRRPSRHGTACARCVCTLPSAHRAGSRAGIDHRPHIRDHISCPRRRGLRVHFG